MVINHSLNGMILQVSHDCRVNTYTDPHQTTGIMESKMVLCMAQMYGDFEEFSL